MKQYTLYALDWLIIALLYMRELIQPSQKVEIEYQGGEALLPAEVMHVQPAMISLLGEKKAIIVQKIHEWCLVNAKKNSHIYEGATWTYGSHADWHKRHFSWMSLTYLGKLFKQLVDDGFLIATDEAPFCFKGQFAYRLNYLKISAGVDWQKVRETTAKSAEPPRNNVDTPPQKVRHNNSSKSSKQINKINQSQTPTPPARARPTKTVVDDGAGVDPPDHDTGEFDSGYGEPLNDDTARMEPILDTVETPPGSASPPSVSAEHDLLVQQIVRDLGHGLTATAVRLQIRLHGAERCGAVSNWIYRHRKTSSIKNPPGFWVDELRHNRLGIEPGYARNEIEDYIVSTGNTYKSGKWADIINS